MSEYRDLAMEELSVRHEDLCKKLFALRNERRQAGKLEKPHEMRATRREIARVLTVMREKRGQS